MVRWFLDRLSICLIFENVDSDIKHFSEKTVDVANQSIKYKIGYEIVIPLNRKVFQSFLYSLLRFSLQYFKIQAFEKRYFVTKTKTNFNQAMQQKIWFTTPMMCELTIFI